MPTRSAWALYTLTITVLIMLTVVFNVHHSSHNGRTGHWPSLSRQYDLIKLAWNQQFPNFKQKKVEGRYVAARRDLGLDEQPIIQSSSAVLPVRGLNHAGMNTHRILYAPKIKRALDLTILDEPRPFPASSKSDLPLSDDADNAPLKLTEDASWDYSNSKQNILDNFAQSAHRDEEEAAAATLAKSVRAKIRAKSRSKKKVRKARDASDGKADSSVKAEGR